MSHAPNYDVLVLGGGPAGAAAACRLAQLGRRVLVLERQEFPRFHVGESLLPASNAIFERLGLTERLRAEDFVVKRGASFSTEDGTYSAYIDFSATANVPTPVTYQVPRARFDQMLLDHASDAGAEVRYGCHVRQVDFGAETSSTGVRVTSGPQETPETTDADLVIDATGQAGLLAKRLGLRRLDPDLRNVALFAHFENLALSHVEALSLGAERAGDIRIVSRRDMGWIWLIPLSATVTSVGVVLPKAAFDAQTRAGESREEMLQRLLRDIPVLATASAGSQRITPAHVAADFSYAPSAYAGDRWLLAGDAGSFLDPVFSSGVLLALESGVEAAEAADRVLGTEFSTGRRSGRRPDFTAFERTQRHRYRRFRGMVRGFYDPAFRDLFFHPANHFGILDTIITLLSGEWRLTLASRLRLRLFFGLVALQRLVPLSPRYHRRAR